MVPPQKELGRVTLNARDRRVIRRSAVVRRSAKSIPLLLILVVHVLK